MSDDQDKTPVACLACGGQWRMSIDRGHGVHAEIACRFCTMGQMNEAQRRAWARWRDSHPSIPPPPPPRSKKG